LRQTNFKQKIYFSTTAALRATLDDGSRSKGPMNSSNLIGRKLEIKIVFSHPIKLESNHMGIRIGILGLGQM
jgi:hypothetical protein